MINSEVETLLYKTEMWSLFDLVKEKDPALYGHAVRTSRIAQEGESKMHMAHRKVASVGFAALFIALRGESPFGEGVKYVAEGQRHFEEKTKKVNVDPGSEAEKALILARIVLNPDNDITNNYHRIKIIKLAEFLDTEARKIDKVDISKPDYFEVLPGIGDKFGHQEIQTPPHCDPVFIDDMRKRAILLSSSML